MFEEDGKKRDVSEFNSAVSFLNRLNMIIAKCDECSMDLDINGWHHSLMVLYRELSTEMTEDEKEQFEKDINVLQERLSEYIINNRGSNINEVSPELYKDHHDFEMALRKVMKESGLQQKIMDEASKMLN